jgi:excisionase family DNA binding protein
VRRSDELLTTEEVATRLRVHKATVARWARSGVLEAVRVTGRTIRFRASDVDALLDGEPVG